MNLVIVSPLIRTLSAIAVFAVVVLQLARFWPLPLATMPNNQEISAADIAEYLGDDFSILEVAYERPLFHANRRRPVEKIAVAAPVVQAPEAEFTLQLVGIMGANEATRTAFLMDSSNQQTHTVKRGQIVAGWSVISIESVSIRLSKDLEEKTLSLD